MMGDGANDAPSLAQADVGLAMNSGTQAAKEAGNMADLDSDPTKLIEAVAIGKQLLMTRGALTTFSIANDVAKYFAIVPAMFAGTLPWLKAIDVMNLHSPTSAILSAVIFNALIIPLLIPIALKGVQYRPLGADALLRRNLLIWGLGGVLTGIGLVLGYALLGAGWIVLKSDAELREWARERIPWLTLTLLAVLIVAFGAALSNRERIGSDLSERLGGLIFPGIGLLAMAGVLIGVRQRRDCMPFAMTVVFFVASFLTLAVLFWPYMIPYQVTVADAAAPDKSLSFLFWGAGVFVLPVIVIYTAVVYWAFPGKLRHA
jgi:magnesium-transporting ATPase (P-type)